jgi:tetratricopeptide (TPR) repeat protein
MGREEEARVQYRQFLDDIERGLAVHPEDIDYHYLNALGLIRLGKVEEGLNAGEKAYRMDTTRHMDYARVLAVRGDTDRALEQVDQALKHGYRDFCWIKMNPDLASLQKEERFRKLLAAYFD